MRCACGLLPHRRRGEAAGQGPQGTGRREPRLRQRRDEPARGLGRCVAALPAGAGGALAAVVPARGGAAVERPRARRAAYRRGVAPALEAEEVGRRGDGRVAARRRRCADRVGAWGGRRIRTAPPGRVGGAARRSRGRGGCASRGGRRDLDGRARNRRPARGGRRRGLAEALGACRGRQRSAQRCGEQDDAASDAGQRATAGRPGSAGLTGISRRFSRISSATACGVVGRANR